MDIPWWIAVGLVAGMLASALMPGRTPAGLIGVVAIGVLGALLGGWVWAMLFGDGPATFLGSVTLSVLGATVLQALLHRFGGTRYRV